MATVRRIISSTYRSAGAITRREGPVVFSSAQQFAYWKGTSLPEASRLPNLYTPATLPTLPPAPSRPPQTRLPPCPQLPTFQTARARGQRVLLRPQRRQTRHLAEHAQPGGH